MIIADHVSTSIKKMPVLRDVSFRVKKGEFVALVGPNGAGKTTLLKHLNGLLKPGSGTVRISSMDTRKVATSRLARSVGFLFQNPDRQILCPTVKEEIIFGLKHCGFNRDEWESRVIKAAEEAGIAGKLDADPLLLTRSRRQRVALASVLATDPDILVLDEPTSAQDEKETIRMMDLAAARCKEGKIVLLVSHDMEVVSRYAGRVIVLIEGSIAFDGKPKDLFVNREILSRAALCQPQAYRLTEALSLVPAEPGTDPVEYLADQIECMNREEAI